MAAATSGAAAASPGGGNNSPAAAPGPIPAGPSAAGLMQYFRDVRVELKKAEWPSRAELIRLTQVTLILIAIVSAYCGSLDALLSLITNRLFNHAPALLLTTWAF